VKNVFLHGILEEEVYIKQPPRFENPQYRHHICKLDKTIYGLKQAPRAWYSKLSSKLHDLGFKSSKGDTCLFIYQKKDATNFLLIYVDEIIVTISSNQANSALLHDLSSHFTLKDLGDLNFFLDIKVEKKHDRLILTRDKYVADFIAKVGMMNCTSVPTAMSSTDKLSLKDGEPLGPEDITHYRRLIYT
jgi:histone deacetylase 1/2